MSGRASPSLSLRPHARREEPSPPLPLCHHLGLEERLGGQVRQGNPGGRVSGGRRVGWDTLVAPGMDRRDGGG